MGKKRWARLAYSHSFNLGDMIQTLATEVILEENLISVERHNLKKYQGEPVKLIMQGYFFHDDFHCTFPPSEQIEPIFFGFHVEDKEKSKKYFSSDDVVSYFKKHQPIGCRDRTTVKFLSDLGINAYFTRCLTLIFSRRKDEPQAEKVFFIDTPSWLKPRALFGKKFNDLYNKGEHLTQIYDEDFQLSDFVKSSVAKSRLETLKKEAKMVVTSRLHVAAPCLAMGIPVVILPRTTTPVRYEAIEGLNRIYWLPTRNFSNLGPFKKYFRLLVRILYVRYIIDWGPTAPNIESEKKEIIENFKKVIL